MLQFIRSKASSLVIKMLFFCLVVAFGIWGIGDILHQAPPPPNVATIGGDPDQPERVSARISAAAVEPVAAPGRAVHRRARQADGRAPAGAGPDGEPGALCSRWRARWACGFARFRAPAAGIRAGLPGSERPVRPAELLRLISAPGPHHRGHVRLPACAAIPDPTSCRMPSPPAPSRPRCWSTRFIATATKSAWPTPCWSPTAR